MNIQWVKQEHARGCGVACLAMLTGKTYAEVHGHFPDVNDTMGLRSSDYRHIDRYLAASGLAVARIYRQDKGTDWCPGPFAPAHMVEVGNGPGAPCSHFVVMLADGTVLDPLTAEPKRLTDYHEVYNVAGVVTIAVKHTCPVCSYDGLTRPAADDLICPCCGTHFGLDDYATSRAELRTRWIAGGAKWWSESNPAPAGWKPPFVADQSQRVPVDEAELLVSLRNQCRHLADTIDEFGMDMEYGELIEAVDTALTDLAEGGRVERPARSYVEDY